MVKIKIIAGSSRPGAFNPQPASWIYEIAKKRTDLEVELINVADLNLPFLDEPVPPLMHQYSKDHTKEWSTKIEPADGFIFVTPEYNHSFPALFKNAIDYLNWEWNYKPVTFVSYGSEAGGSRAVEHWRGVAGELRMYDLREQIILQSYWEKMNDKGQYQFTESQEKEATRLLDALVFWAEAMKEARAKMPAKK